MLIREVILENFMSYEYARIPLKPGLNIICGPNGSGKSSIILAISVALGQIYTERSRRLSDLIRWGKDSARVTIVFDNTPKNKKRPVSKFDVDYFRLSRYLKKDNNYWFEANFQTVTKSEVTGILSDFGINPDNMLIIMHQHMMEEFGIVSPSQKLLMVEEAIGLGEYKNNLLEAQEKLSQILSEGESIKSLLENTEQTLAYWKEEYRKYQGKKELIQRKDFLEKELFWSQLIREEEIVNIWRMKKRKKEEALTLLQKDIEKANDTINTIEKSFRQLRHEERKAFYFLLILEKEKSEHEVTMKIYEKMQNKIIFSKELLLNKNISKEDIKNLESYLTEINFQINSSKEKLNEIENKISNLQSELKMFEEKNILTSNQLLDIRVQEGILNFQKGNSEDELNEINIELGKAERNLDKISYQSKNAGYRIETKRTSQEILEEIKITNVQLLALGEVSEEVEKMYLTYSNMFNELRTKAITVSENREKALLEVEERRQSWRSLITSLLDKVSLTFQNFLSQIGATGKIRLTNIQDIESAGLELVVGFKGAEPTILDAHTQSGGERSAATMAFLLALQQHVKSPFRAVDEFDVHMDPLNREIFSDLLFKELSKNLESQYLTITPGQITKISEKAHVITVQNVEGKAKVKSGDISA